jgi:hypothetical protein
MLYRCAVTMTVADTGATCYTHYTVLTATTTTQQSLMRTVEDYMWFKLHFCRAHASVAYKTHRASGSSSSGQQQQQQPAAVFTLAHLQAEVTNKYGPAHFDKVSTI